MKRIVLAALMLGTALAGSAHGLARSDEPTEVEIVIHHSRFTPDHLSFRSGEHVVFTVRNTDPIDHELIIGDDSVQLRHELGTEAHHGTVPGEVSIPAGEVRTTHYVFDRKGVVTMACHLPGHLRYGMRGSIEVR